VDEPEIVRLSLDPGEIEFDRDGRVILPSQFAQALTEWQSEQRSFSFKVDLYCGHTNSDCPCGPTNKLCFCTNPGPDAHCSFPMGDQRCV
jgi:hypothetical protein